MPVSPPVLCPVPCRARWLVVLLVVVCWGCGDGKSPAGDEPRGQALAGPWVGYWESTARSKGGIGSALYIRPGGRVLAWMCVLVDGEYAVVGDELRLGDDAERVRFQVDGASMTQTSESGEELVMTRVGSGTGIVGAWRFEHYVGQEAFQRFDADGTLGFRLIMGTIVVRRYEPIGDDSIALRAGKRFERSVLHVRGGELVADDGTTYVRVGDDPWYPLP